MPTPLSFEVLVTLEDQLALQMRCMATPAMQAGQIPRMVRSAVIAALCAPLLVAGGILLLWAQGSGETSLGSLLSYLVRELPEILVIAMLVMFGCTLAGDVIQRWMVKSRLRRLLCRVLRAHPDVDPADPKLAYRARVTVGNEGLESRTAAGVTLVSWRVLKHWEETEGHLLVTGDGMDGFCLSTSAVEPEPMDRLRSILMARLGPRDACRGDRGVS